MSNTQPCHFLRDPDKSCGDHTDTQGEPASMVTQWTLAQYHGLDRCFSKSSMIATTCSLEFRTASSLGVSPCCVMALLSSLEGARHGGSDVVLENCVCLGGEQQSYDSCVAFLASIVKRSAARLHIHTA